MPPPHQGQYSGKEKAHKHKQIFPVTARAGGGGLPTGWGGGVYRPVARGQKFMCCVRNPSFVRAPSREESGSRPGGSVTGATEKLFMCQMFMCLFRPQNTLKTAPIPNKVSSCCIEVGVRLPYFGGLYAMCSVKIPLFAEGRRDFTPDDPFFQSGGPKAPRHTKNSTRREKTTIRSELTTRSDPLLKI